MSSPKPHRRLSLTQATTPLPAPEENDSSVATLAAGIRAIEERLAAGEDRLVGTEEETARAALPPAGSAADPTRVTTPFRVADSEGRTVAEIDVLEGRPCLRLFNRKEKPVAMLSAEACGGSLGILNGDGDLVTSLVAGEEGGGFTLRDRHGEAVAVLCAQPHGGAFQVLDPGGRTVLSLSSGDRGGRLDIADGAGTGVIQLGVRETGGGLAVYDNAGRPAAVLGCGAHGGGLGIYHHDGQPAALLRADVPGGRLDINDRVGHGAVRIDVRETGGSMAVYHRAGPAAAVLSVAEPEPDPAVPPRPPVRAVPTLPASRCDETALRAFSQGARKAVGVYAETAHGVLKVYDQAGKVVFSQS